MAKNYNIPRGTADILPAEIGRWRQIEDEARRVFGVYGFSEIRTPLFEETELFARSMGQTSDVVQKQMLNLAAQNPNQPGVELSGLSLRPEGTAAVVRSYIQNNLDRKESRTKLFYLGAMFRGERPQKGRLRQFHQIGAEVIGPQTTSPYLDAEMIALSLEILRNCGVANPKLKLNSLGTPEDKENSSKQLRERLQPAIVELCEDCQSRFERNIFRVLDCKKKTCNAVVDKLQLGYAHLSEESRQYFEAVKTALVSLGVDFEESPRLVRGLDYYTHTVFEISSSSLGSQDALGAGGRYNNLVRDLGGSAVDAVGFALGIERIILATEGQAGISPANLEAFIVALDENTMKKAFVLSQLLRQNGVSADISYRWNSALKNQLNQANKLGAKRVLILGPDELAKNAITIKDMNSGEQQVVSLDQVVSHLKK